MKTLSLIACILLCAAGCKKEKQTDDVPDCIARKIMTISKGKVWNPPAKIYRYQYLGQTVYYFPSHCCDIPGILYNEECQAICSPDGGFTGKGDGSCTDFVEERTEEELVWEDDRG